MSQVTADAHRLTDVVTRLRRALRTSIRTDYPWESLPMAQVELLMCVADHEPARVGELAELLRLAPNTVSGLVQQLGDARLVLRAVDPADRRVARVTLTDAGRAKLHDWQQAHERRISAALDTLSAPDRASVLTALPALDRLVTALSEPEPQVSAAAGTAHRR